MSASSKFAHSLKSYGNVNYRPNPDNKISASIRCVIEFDKKSFQSKCNPVSSDFDSSIDLNVVASELFKIDEVWATRDDLLHSTISEHSKLHGYNITKDSTTIYCNRHGKSTTKRQYVEGDLKCGCPFMVKMKPLSKTNYKSKPTSKQWSYKSNWNAPVIITHAVCVHGENCVPGRQNRITTGQRSGQYVVKLPSNSLYTLCNFLQKNGSLRSQLIKHVLEPVWPKSKNITKHDCFNMRVRVNRLMPIYKSTDGNYTDFQEVANANDLLDGIDNAPTLDDDEAYALAQSLWLEVMSTMNDEEDMIFSFIDYLELIKTRAKGFVYRLASSENNMGGERSRKKLLGVIWQTATMRRNFELFGGYICLDMMMRGINTLSWPYVAAAMYDDDDKLVIGCEGILCGETVDMYRCLSTFLSDFSPRRSLADVEVVSGDGFFDQKMVCDLGFTNAKFIMDQYHLIDSGLSRKFGKSGSDLLKGHLLRMIHAPTKDDFENTLMSAKDLLISLLPRNGQYESDLEEFAQLRETYSKYCLEQIPGNRGRLGDQIGESNHSSTLCYLNEGSKKGNNFCEHPIVLIRQLLKRQRKHVNQTNARLFGEVSRLNTERFRLNNEPSTPSNSDLLLAANTLNYTEYERYKSFQRRAENDLMMKKNSILQPKKRVQ